MTELAKRLVACKGWRWMPGMRAVGRSCFVAWFRVEEPLRKLHGDWKDALPDLTDPGTLGCLLALVREAWGDPDAVVFPYKDKAGWECSSTPFVPSHFYGVGKSEAEALVAALEAAP